MVSASPSGRIAATASDGNPAKNVSNRKLEPTMTLVAGTRLGVYEISGLLGVGGMGEVYRATDTKLGRKVAIKTLPPELASDKDRLARFEREAKLLAALNHPHIASVYSLDEHDGTLYLAMELVDGETLDRKLARGLLPLDEALRIALQIAEALEAAHEKGVVHRDLKPANIMVSGEGKVKVLDFGLAKIFATDPKQTALGHSPALSLAMTQLGLVLGTAGYMSPEQASGQATDQRADIWAFGVVLYELLTGKPVFTGESVPHIIAAVLQVEPDWTRLPKNLHPRLRLLLERCLTKRPRNRLQSIGDARIEMESVLEEPIGVTAESSGGRTQQKTLLWLGGSLAFAAAVAMATWFLRPTAVVKPAPVVRLSLSLPSLPSFSWSGQRPPIIGISPDGTRIAYALDQIYVRNLGEIEGHPLEGTAGKVALEPVFSPDGQWLAYVEVDSVVGPYPIKRVPVAGGAPVVIDDGAVLTSPPLGLSWPTADVLLFATQKGIVRLPANGGATEVLVAASTDERLDSPQILPNGDAVLFLRRAGADLVGKPTDKDRQILVQSIGKDDRKVVWQGGSAPRYLRTGQLVYAQGNALFAVSFDPSARAIRGGPVPMVQGLNPGFSDTADFAISDTGTLAVLVNPRDPNANNAAVLTTVSWVDRSGREEPIPVPPNDYTMARVSPDGTKVALVTGHVYLRPEPPSIWLYDLRTQNPSLLSAVPAARDAPVWSADGEKIFFRAHIGRGPADVDVIDLATGEITTVAKSIENFPLALSADGKTLAVVSVSATTGVDIAALSVASGELTTLIGGPGGQTNASFSKNGAWIAYVDAPAGAGGAIEINIVPYPAVTRTRIPVGPGTDPVFSRDGSELFYFDGRGIAVAPVSYEPTLHVGTGRHLFDSAEYMMKKLDARTWDPDPSGQRFLLIRDPGSSAVAAANASSAGPPARIDVVLNWTEELNRRLHGDAH
jgi:eukaryotic-like serine/threonine-protein kinase